MSKLMKTAGAWPFLFGVFFNAFIDLGHKITIQNTLFKVYEGGQQMALTAILNALILLPFILLFSPAGFLSDRLPKTRVMRLSAVAAVLLCLALTLCYTLAWFEAAFVMTLLLATQSAFYSPAKFGYIKAFFGKQNLAEANGLLQTVSIVAILAGTFAFSILFEWLIPDNATSTSQIFGALSPIGLILVATSLLEAWMVFRLPEIESGDKQQTFNTKDFLLGKRIKSDLQPLWQKQVIWLSVIGLAMFWSIGQVMLAAFPAFAKAQINITNAVLVQGIIAASGVGIALGSWSAGRFSRNYIETGLIPVGASGIAAGLLLLPHLNSSGLLALDFFFIGLMGGIFIVPLNSLVQFYAGEKELGRVLAGKNLVQNVAMLSFLIMSVLFSIYGLSSKALLILTSLFAVAGGAYTVFKLPQSLIRFILSRVMSLRYRLHVQGMKNIPETGGVLLLGNHISWIDWAIVQLACPRQVRFVMIKSIYERWYLSWFFKLFGCIPISQGVNSQQSLDIVAERLDKGEVVCLFPEGAISRNGQLGQFRQGFEKAATTCQREIKILPFYLRGLWGSQFSRASPLFKRNRSKASKRDIIIAFGTPQDKSLAANQVKQKVFELSIHSWHLYVSQLPNLPHAWIDTVKRSANRHFALADTNRSAPVSAARALAGAICLARHMGECTQARVGLLLPTSMEAVLANMALLLQGKTLVPLNYTADQTALSQAIEQAEIRSVYSSRVFESKLKARGIEFGNALNNCHVIYLEDIFEKITRSERLAQLVAVKLLPASTLKFLFCKSSPPQSTAVILFTSGSEGSPKGVMLSHQNVMANLKQVAEVLNAEQDDVIMASLPLFNAFGLTITQFLPLVEDIPMVCHPDPSDAFGIAKAIATHQASILFGTSTFFRLYIANEKILPMMLDSLRLVIAGAEKLNPQVRQAFEDKFKKSIFEGYGATETTPVASVNLPDKLDFQSWKAQLGGKIGSVGMPVPGTSFKIVDPNTLQQLPMGEAGLVLIGGVQVMQGYLKNSEKTQEVIKDIDGYRWYLTGDKGKLDADGCLTIIDRYSRLANVGGEIISLTSVEQIVAPFLLEQAPDADYLATAIPDNKQGEKIILLCDKAINYAELRCRLLAADANPAAIPYDAVKVKSIPKLQSGKPDISLSKHLALKKINSL